MGKKGASAPRSTRSTSAKRPAQITWTKFDFTKTVPKFSDTLLGAITIYLSGQETKVQNYARRNATWTDRTSNARNGLTAKYDGGRDRHVIRLFHTVPYGIWLEVRWAGKYAIIVPTIEAEGQRIMKGLQGLITKMGVAGSIAT